MSTPLGHSLKAIGLVVAMSFAAAAQAADPVTDLMQAANAPYRMALFQTNSKDPGEARRALLQAQQAWNTLSTRFGTKPAAPYDRDGSFAVSLGEVSRVYDQALKEVDAGQLETAHNTLERVRDIMAGMRQRNQVVVFSDHMNAYHSQMEVIMLQGNETLTQPRGMLQLTAQAGALTYLAKQLEAQAPADLTKNAEFTGLLKAVNQSVANLEAALLNQDLAAIKDALGKLKGPYSKLFAKFG